MRSLCLNVCIIFYLSFSVGFSSEQAKAFWDAYDPHQFPLNTDVLQSWEDPKGQYQLVRFDLGHLKGTHKEARPKIAAYYGYPKNKDKVPGIVQIHGGGQRASKTRVKSWVELGYACISINWGAKVLEKADTPNTDWDGLAAGFIRPGVGKDLSHHNLIMPSQHTLYKEPHLLNSSWNLIAMSGRRALTFLESRPEVDANKLGVEGHSMGGRSTVLVSIDPRVKASSPSVGGSGFLYTDLWGLKGSARRMQASEGLDLYTQTVSAQAYWPLTKAPTLFLGSTNDFNSPTEFVVQGMALLPEPSKHRLALAPHLNHRFTHDTDASRFFWMEAHLKQDFEFPKSSKATLNLNTSNGIPEFTLEVPPSVHPIQKVEVYYGYARDPRIRFWNSAKVRQSRRIYKADCPVYDLKEPLFAFANITYKTDRTLPGRPGQHPTNLLTITSNYHSIYPEQLKNTSIKATAQRHRVLDDFSRDMQDWYQLSANNPQHWFYSTRKVLDPVFMGPENSTLKVDLKTTGPNNHIAIGLHLNNWQGYTGRKTDTYHAFISLPKEGLNTFKLSPKDFSNAQGKLLKDWDEATELFFTPSVKVQHKLAKQEKWNGKPPELKHLEWLGGSNAPRPYPHETRSNKPIKGSNFNDEFQKAIDDSVQLENLDEKNLHKK